MSSLRRAAIFASGLSLYAATAYSAFGLARILQQPSPDPKIADPKFQKTLNFNIDSSQYTNLASSYDQNIFFDEFLMLLGMRRKRLVSRAKGHILEVSAGTGRNLAFYNKDVIESLTLCDKNESMLKEAWRRKSPLEPEFCIEDCEDLTFPDNSFDTVVDTFGLCSVEDPEKALLEMKRVCRPEGEILLLEHGRANGFFKPYIDELLDKSVINHALTWGCWHNRHIDTLIAEAGLEIVESKRFNFGTTYFIIAKVVK